jgi:hypothetical protein
MNFAAATTPPQTPDAAATGTDARSDVRLFQVAI